MAKKILVIDDDRLIGLSLQRLLELKGYNVSFVDSGEMAIQKVRETKFDLIISDIKMGKLDGIETIKRIRDYLKSQSKDLIPEFLITGYAESESYQMAKELKVVDILYKPFDNAKFIQIVERALTLPAIPPEVIERPRLEVILPNIEEFFGASLPNYIKELCKNNYILEKFNQQQIMEIIDFSRPFLKIEKMIVLGLDRNDILQNISLATGILTTNDTKGHYNDTIFLAECGRLMGSAASIYLAILFSSTAPQVVEVDHIKPSKDRTLWKPSSRGSRFFIETRILKKKLQVIIVNVKITFGDIFMGEVEKLKLVLTPKDSIWEAKELPTWE